MVQSGDTNAWVKVYNFIREKIINGDLKPGERINERKISQLVKVSRTPVREAFRNLENEGYVTNRPKKGVFVKKYSPEELDVLYKILIFLEGLAVEMAVPKLTKADIKTLQQMNNKLKSLDKKKNSLDCWPTDHSEFHLFFAKKSGSQELLDLISQLRKKTFRAHYTKIIMMDRALGYVNDHDEIINAIKGQSNKDPARCMESHVERTRKALADFYREFVL